ncbi:MAG: hypothetical protein C0501_09825 [Isosphaera sp.]|nr:hypothetical protein [Isosphaera sp.]
MPADETESSAANPATGPVARPEGPPDLSVLAVFDHTSGAHQLRVFAAEKDARSRAALAGLYADAAAACRRELEAVRAAFFAGGPGRELRTWEVKLGSARGALADVERERADVQRRWRQAVADDDEAGTRDLERRRAGLDADAERLRARVPAIQGKIDELRERLGPQLVAAVRDRLTRFLSDADRQKADALARIAAVIPGPFLAWFEAFARRNGAAAFESTNAKTFRALVALDDQPSKAKAKADPPAPDPARAFAFDRGDDFPERRPDPTPPVRNPFGLPTD